MAKKMQNPGASPPSAAALADSVKASAQQIWLAGLGAYAKAQEEGQKVFNALVKAHPHLGRVDQLAENSGPSLPVKPMGKADFRNVIKDFYLTNPVARASSVMAELSATAKARAAAPMAAE